MVIWDEPIQQVNSQQNEYGSQCTLLWYIEDLNISHMESKVADRITSRLNKKYGEDALIAVTLVKFHDNLGMIIEFSSEGKAIIWMEYYANNTI